ncbi:MAG TPA: ATP-binding protein [Kiloniellaceae bacterium]|nr:ATP-binding protein [Kiloniellaceae bacterium]
MRRWLPKSLAGQMIALLLIVLVLAQAVSLIIFADERRMALRAAAREQVLQRTASMALLLDDMPAAYRGRMVKAASTPQLRFSLSDDAAVPADEAVAAGHPLAKQLLGLLQGTAGEVRLSLIDDRGFFSRFHKDALPPPPGEVRGERHDDDDFDDHEDHGKGHRERPPEPRGLGLEVSLSLKDGEWLNVVTVLALPPPGWAWVSLVSMLLVALALCVVVVVMVRRITRPLKRLAVASEAFGRGAAAAALPEVGPGEVRQTTAAFNLMRERLTRYVSDRTRMLAAVSHDLRTPITTLRLRAEFIEDESIKSKILDTLDEMQRMTEEVLAFVREEATAEATRCIDVAALIESLVADLAEIGRAVTFQPAAKTPYACRPAGLRRALSNVIENAVAYGKRARVALQDRGKDLAIVVDDDGPGISPADVERVFEPFVRLEESRSRETGGIGLGLAIARSIVRGHGGDITLENRPEGGLRLSLLLPKEPLS